MSFNDHLSTFKARLSNLNKRTRSFSRIFPWIFRDFFVDGWRRCIILLAMAGISVGFRVSVVALLLSSIRKFASTSTGSASDGLIDVPYLGAIDYTLFGVLMFACLATNSFVSFIYERAVFLTAGSYQPIVLKRSLRLYAELPNLYRLLDLPPSILKNFIGALGRHGRMITIFLRIILFSSLEFISALACYIALIFISTTITIVFTIIILLFLPIFYYLSLYAVRKRQHMPVAFGAFTTKLRELGRQLQSPHLPADDQFQKEIEELVDGPVGQNAFDAFFQQRFVVFKSQFVSGVLTAIILALSVTLFFASFRESEAFGGDFALFFALLFVMGMSLARSLRALVSGNRFFDSLKFFYALLGPGSYKGITQTKSANASLAYRRMDGDVFPLDGKCVVYLYIDNPESRFSFQPVVNQICPVRERLCEKSGSLVLLRSPAEVEAFDPADGNDLVFVSDALLGSQRSKSSHDLLKMIFGDGPRFIILEEPLEDVPAKSEQWLYVWGTQERVFGDLAHSDNLQLPKPERLSKRLAAEHRKSRGQDMLDIEELEG